MTFKEDLIFGEVYEMKFARQTKQKFTKMTGNFKDYDIILHTANGDITYEIKTDKMTYNTGNFAIEYSCRNKPSGISATKAKYWVYIEIIDYDEIKGLNYDYEYNLYIIPVKDLAKLINTNQYHKIVSGGDNYSVKLMLFRKTIFSKYKVEQFSDDFYIYKDIPVINGNPRKSYTEEELEEMLSN
jgi:hypothetical protein